MKHVLNELTPVFETLVWIALVLGLLIGVRPELGTAIVFEPYISISGFTRVIWPYASLITVVVLRFSRRYLSGHHRKGFFFLRCTLFLLAVLCISATDHMLLLLGSWLLMGWQMASLIGHKADWPQASSAGTLARKYFLTGTVFLAISLVALYSSSGTFEISSSLSLVDQIPGWKVNLIFGGIFLAVMIQSALYPVQDWLMSSMTAPTPASTLMHAGFVNAGGLLLTIFAPVFINHLSLMLLLVVVGGGSALMGKIWKMVQPVVKRELACSTVAQMGFMVLQCGLGFFSAAITHLVLHGFYKGYLFLDSGSAIQQTQPDDGNTSEWSVSRLLGTLVTAVVAGGVFIGLTGKGTTLNSGVFLTAMVVFTVLHGCKEFFSHNVPSRRSRYLFPVVAITATGIYSGIYVGITALMSDVPWITAPTTLTGVHLMLLGMFVLFYALIETNVYRNIPWLFVYVLNASQPHPDTVLASREEYHV